VRYPRASRKGRRHISIAAVDGGPSQPPLLDWIEMPTEPTETVYTVEGVFVPKRRPAFTPYARRVEHQGRHHVKARGSFGRWLHSMAREVGDILLSALSPSLA
jgi:hypothetical protein